MAYAIKRKFPRVPFAHQAEVEFLDRRAGERIQLVGTIHTVACEGMGITMDETALQALERKTRINIAFELEDGEVSLPGAVAWIKGSELGVHLLLQLALPETRQRWAHWIVAQTQSMRRRRPSTGKQRR